MKRSIQSPPAILCPWVMCIYNQSSNPAELGHCYSPTDIVLAADEYQVLEGDDDDECVECLICTSFKRDPAKILTYNKLVEHINMCDTCAGEYPDCEGFNLKFGVGVGKDNIIECDSYKQHVCVNCPDKDPECVNKCPER